MRASRTAIDIETELCGLDGRLAREPDRTNAIDPLEVVVGDRLRFLEVGDVLAKAREHRPNTVRRQAGRRLQHVVERLPRHEPRDRPPNKRRAHTMLAQPAVIRRFQKNRPHKGADSVVAFAANGNTTSPFPPLTARRTTHSGPRTPDFALAHSGLRTPHSALPDSGLRTSEPYTCFIF